MSARGNDKVIRKYIESLMPKRLRKLASAATTDLYSGPFSKADHRALGFSGWPGYTTAIEKIQTWIDDEMPTELWLDTQADDVLTNEPQGETVDGEWQEPFWEDYVHFERRAIMRVVFGELASNGLD